MAEAPSEQRKPLLIFIHIPKTAGTTLTTLLKMNEPGGRSRALGNVFKGAGGVKQGVSFQRLRDEKGARNLEGVRVLTGHFPLGIREYLPEDRDVRCFTFLRDPADRTLSHYFQISQIAERDRALGRERPKRESFGLKPLPPDPALDDMLQHGYIHDNLHTRMLSGLREPFGEVTEEMLQRAKHNLREELVFFGLTERFDESLVLAKRRLGVGTVLHKPPGSGPSGARVNTSRPRGDEVPEELVRAAERCNRYDIELYRYAEELFEGAPERSELEFEVELAALRAARGDGEIELEAPESFVGDEGAWRMLLRARVTLLRHERELAEIKALTYNLGQDDQKILEALRSFRAKGKRVAGRDADAAATQVIQLLGTIGAALPAEDAVSAGSKPSGRATRPRQGAAAGSRAGAGGVGSQKGRGAGGGKRATGAKRGRGRQPSRPAADRSPRKGRRRGARNSQDG